MLALRMFPDLDKEAVEQLHNVVDAENADEIEDVVEIEEAKVKEEPKPKPEAVNQPVTSEVAVSNTEDDPFHDIDF